VPRKLSRIKSLTILASQKTLSAWEAMVGKQSKQGSCAAAGVGMAIKQAATSANEISAIFFMVGSFKVTAGECR